MLIKTENGQFRETYHEETRLADPHQNAGNGRSNQGLEPLKYSNVILCDLLDRIHKTFYAVNHK